MLFDEFPKWSLKLYINKECMANSVRFFNCLKHCSTFEIVVVKYDHRSIFMMKKKAVVSHDLLQFIEFIQLDQYCRFQTTKVINDQQLSATLEILVANINILMVMAHALTY